MSVIVKGMKMPNSCASCPLLEYDDFATGNEYKCTALREFMGVDELPVGRRKDCPLTEVIRCEECKYNPKTSYTGCPIASISGRTETDYCSRAEVKNERGC